MKRYILLFTFITFSLSISPGVGFSGDRESFANIVCFKQTKRINPGKAEINFERSFSSSEIEEALTKGDKLKLNIALTSYFNFGFSKESSFMREIKETDYSASFSYFIKMNREVEFGLDGFEEDALTKDGLLVYQNSFDDFGLSCGDYIVEAMEEVAFAIINVKYKFSVKQAKEAFRDAYGINITKLFGFSKSVFQAHGSRMGDVTISINAFQLGGNSERLTNIFNGASISTCDIRNIDNCHDLLNSILNYTSTDFVNQFGNKDNYTLVNPTFAKLIKIDDIGLTSPESYVDETVVKARQELVRAYKEIEQAEMQLYNNPNDETLRIVYESNKDAFSKNSKLIRKCYSNPFDCDMYAKTFMRSYRPMMNLLFKSNNQ